MTDTLITPPAHEEPASTGEISATQPDPPAPSSPRTIPGATANSPVALPRSAWWEILKRVYVMDGFHNLSLLAAGVAFFTFLALTPLIGATVMIYGLIGNVDTVQKQMDSIIRVVPKEAAKLIQDQLVAIVTTNASVTGLALIVALFFAIYGGMRAASGLIGALNVINEEHETRGIVRLTRVAAALTLAMIFIAALGIVSGGVFAWLQTHTSSFLGPVAAIVSQVLAWALAICLGSVAFALIMRFAPDRRPAKWRWLSPGAVLATVLWLLVSFGFSLYVAYVSDYSKTYGSLSAIVVFLMWLYLSAYAVLIGALLNAEIERQTNRDSTVGVPKPAGKRGAVLADTVNNTTPDAVMLAKRQQRKSEHASRHQHDDDPS